MEFWGAEIKSGESIVVEYQDGKLLHLSQACLGEVKKYKGTEPVYLFAKVGDQKFVLGILSLDKNPQTTLNLVFGKKVEISHNWKNGSVHFLGYTGYEYESDEESDTESGSESDSDSDSEDDMVPVPIDPGTSTLQAKKELKGVNLNNVVKSDVKGSADNDEEDESDDDSSEESSDDEQVKVKKEDEESSNDELESDDEESDDSEEEDEKDEGKKVDTSKKRPVEAATKTSAPDKKAKLVTPEKSGGKTSGNKVVHVATPYPTKQSEKIAAKSNQPKQQTPNTARAFACKSCSKSFGSDVALQSHTKAKHANGN